MACTLLVPSTAFVSLSRFPSVSSARGDVAVKHVPKIRSLLDPKGTGRNGMAVALRMAAASSEVSRCILCGLVNVHPACV